MIETVSALLNQIVTNRAVMQTITVLILLYSLYSIVVLAKLKAYPIRPFVFPVFVVVETVLFYFYILATNPPPSESATFFSVLIRAQTAAAFALTIKYLTKRVT